MKTIDIQSLLNSINELLQKITSQKTQLTDLQHTIENFVSLENSFKGDGGESIRRFYQEWHIPYLSYRHMTLENYEQVLFKLKQATMELDSDSSGYIMQSFLEGELTNGLNKIKNITAGLVDEGNGYMDSVSDIVALPRLHDGEFQGRVQRADNHAMQTIQDLHSYDNAQTSELATLDNSIHLMNGYLQDLTGIFKDGTFTIQNYNLKLSEYPDYLQLQAEVAKQKLMEFNKVFTNFFTMYWAMLGSFFIKNNLDDEEFVYKMLRGYERRYEEVERLAGVKPHENAVEFVDGDHQVARGEEMDLAAIEEYLGVPIETFNLRGIPLHYAVVDGNLVIFRDNPDLWYYTQNTEYKALFELMGIAGKTTATSMGDYLLAKGANRIPGVSTINGKIDQLPEIPGSGGTKVGDIGKEQLSEAIQKKIPFWGEIISAPVPKAGTKQVFVYVDDNGDEYNRRVAFTLTPDGVLSIDDWYTGELNTHVKKEKEKVNIHDLLNWLEPKPDENNSKTASQEAQNVVTEFALKPNTEFTQGKGLDLNELEFVEDVNIHTTSVSDIPINYSVIEGELVIFPDNPDVYYSQQNVEHGKINEVIGNFVKKGVESVVDHQIGNVVGKIPGSTAANDYLDSMPNIYGTGTTSGELTKSTVNQFVQGHIPGWEKIKNAPVPADGEKEVLVTISADGVNVTGVKLFRLKDDGTITLY